MNGTVAAIGAILLWICILGLLTSSGCTYQDRAPEPENQAARKDVEAEAVGASSASCAHGAGPAQVPAPCAECGVRFTAFWCACSPGITQRLTGRIWMDEREKK